MKLITAGRSNTTDFFRLSGIREYDTLTHNPALLFVEEGKDTMQVLIIDKPTTILEYNDDVQVMMQWPGKWRSDFFKFTVGDLRKYCEENPKKDYYNI